MNYELVHMLKCKMNNFSMIRLRLVYGRCSFFFFLLQFFRSLYTSLQHISALHVQTILDKIERAISFKHVMNSHYEDNNRSVFPTENISRIFYIFSSIYSHNMVEFYHLRFKRFLSGANGLLFISRRKQDFIA